jgi:Reverse transcriptase (RNA-dependent DNA polymerase)
MSLEGKYSDCIRPRIPLNATILKVNSTKTDLKFWLDNIDEFLSQSDVLHDIKLNKNLSAEVKQIISDRIISIPLKKGDGTELNDAEKALYGKRIDEASRSKAAHSAMRKLLEPALHALIEHNYVYGDAYGLLSALKDKFSPTSQVITHNSIKELVMLKRIPGESATCAIKRLTDIRSEIDETKPCWDSLALMGLLGLFPEYQDLILTNSITHSTLCFEQITKLVLTRDHHNLLDQVKTKTETATGQMFHMKHLQNEEKKCEICDKSNHTTKNCFLNPRNKKSGEVKSRLKKTPCVHCRKTNHSSDKCFKKRANEKDEEKTHYMNMVAHFITLTDENNTGNSDQFIVDSGATTHACNDETLFKELTPCTPFRVQVANKQELVIDKTGEIVIGPFVSSEKKLILRNVAFHPNLARNVISVSSLDKEGLKLETANRKMSITTKDKLKVEIASLVNGLYTVNLLKDVIMGIHQVEDPDTQALKLIHERAGHISAQKLAALVRKNASEDSIGKNSELIKNVAKFECTACAVGKAHKMPFSSEKRNIKAQDILYRIHCDISGPIVPSLVDNNRYLSILVDEYSGMIFAHTSQTKSDTPNFLINQLKKLENITGKKLKHFHSDGGGEYRQTDLLNHLKENGVCVTYSTPHTPQHNGMAERAFRTIFNLTRSMLKGAGMPSCLWDKAALAAIYTYNRVMIQNHKEKTPYELFFGAKPLVSHLRVFGCDIEVYEEGYRTKLEDKARIGLHIGYSEQTEVYKCLLMNPLKIVTSRNVTFNESKFHYIKSIDDSTIKEPVTVGPIFAAEVIDSGTNNAVVVEAGKTCTSKMSEITEAIRHMHIPEEEFSLPQEWFRPLETSEPTPPLSLSSKRNDPWYDLNNPIDRRNYLNSTFIPKLSSTKRAELMNEHPQLKCKNRINWRAISENEELFRNICDKFGSDIRDIGHHDLHFMHELIVQMDQDVLTPGTYTDAIKSIESDKWRAAMQEEYDIIIRNNTFDLVIAPPNVNILSNRWVFKRKIDANGNVIKYKARLVVKGFKQIHGKDFHETFAPVMKYTSFRIILSYAACKDYEVKQLDVDSAFLNATLKEDVYMYQPEGFALDKNQICKLKKSLYGLKQAPHAWYNDILSTIQQILKMTKCASDPCVFSMKSKTNKIIIMSIFVDDIIVAYHHDDENEWIEMKAKIIHKYRIKDLGDAKWVLAMNVSRNRAAQTIFLDQANYLGTVLKRLNMEKCNPSLIPGTPLNDLFKFMENARTEENASSNPILKTYQKIIGSLLYASISTRPDIAHAVSMCSRFSHNPSDAHLTAAKKILRYIKRSPMDKLLIDGKINGEITNKMIIEVYCDADWAGDKLTRRSTTGYVIKVNNSIVSWLSKKQESTAKSTAEAEIIAMGTAIKETIWIENLLIELDPKCDPYINIYCDNQSAITIVNQDMANTRSKHIAVNYHFIQDYIKKGNVTLQWISTGLQLADIFTKPLDRIKFHNIKDKIITH